MRYMALTKVFLILLNFILTHTSRYTAAGTKAVKQCNDIFPERCYVKDYKNAKLVNLPSC